MASSCGPVVAGISSEADNVDNPKTENRKRGRSEVVGDDGPTDLNGASFDSDVSTSNLQGESTPSRRNRHSQSAMLKKSIGRFLIENGIGFEAVKSYGFKKMMEITSGTGDITSHIPSIEELKGWVLSDERKEIEEYVKEVRKSWVRTGCSIVLDVWVDGRGRDLMIVFVDCPLGAIYLQSCDISTMANDVDGMVLLLEGVLADVGVQNVLQIIAHESSEVMDGVGKRLREKYRSLFWSVSASHCLSLMLEKIGMVNSVKQVTDKAKTVTKFIYSHAEVLKTMRKHTSSSDLIKPSKMRSSMPFLTLENFLMEKENLKQMISSSEWTNSTWASDTEGKRVTGLLNDKLFWSMISTVVRAAIPLVRVLSLINGDGDPHVGFIYETMDQVKETVANELNWRSSRYYPYWEIIDDIWNNILHSPLHAAGYFLNPAFLYTEDFCADPEVAGGLLVSIVRLVEDKAMQDLITKQLDLYRGCRGEFKRGTENDMQISTPPAAWWSSFGGHCPELQKLAIRILSQTCNGAESYGLKRDVAERLLCGGGRSSREQNEVSDLAYIHYNIHLKQNKMGAQSRTEEGEIGLFGDWIQTGPIISEQKG